MTQCTAAVFSMALVLFALGCGGSQEAEGTKPTPPQADAATDPAPTPEQRNAAKLKEAQAQGCGGYCDRATQCAVEDAKANMSAKELEELNLAETTPVFRKKCMDECTSSELSVRQVEVMHQCLQAAESTCEQFATCMDAMKPQAK